MSGQETAPWMEHDVVAASSTIVPPPSDLLRTRELLGVALRALEAAASLPFWPSLLRRFPTALPAGEDGENQEREEICFLFVCCLSSNAVAQKQKH